MEQRLLAAEWQRGGSVRARGNAVLALNPRTQVELFLLGGAVESGGDAFASGDGLSDVVEVSGADECLVLDGAVTFGLGGELLLLEGGVGRHGALFVILSEV